MRFGTGSQCRQSRRMLYTVILLDAENESSGAVHDGLQSVELVTRTAN